MRQPSGFNSTFAQFARALASAETLQKGTLLKRVHTQIAQMSLSEPEPFSHLKERLLGMVGAGYDGLPPAVPWTYPFGSLRAAISTRRLCNSGSPNHELLVDLLQELHHVRADAVISGYCLNSGLSG